MTDPTDDIDPTTATTQEEFAHCLYRLRIRTDLSYRELESWGQDHGQPLPRTTVLEVLHGRRFPRKSFLLAFVEACGVDPATDTRWERTWSRLSELVKAPVSATPVDTDDDRGDTVVVGLPDADDEAEPAIPTEIWERAQGLLQQARASAGREARKVVLEARAEADGILDRARTEAAEIRSAAERDAEQILLTARDRAVREAGELREAILADLETEWDELERHRSAARTPGSGGTDKRTGKDPERPRADGKPRRRGWFGRS
jgi:vacuolar-type H+-ATPase subunit H